MLRICFQSLIVLPIKARTNFKVPVVYAAQIQQIPHKRKDTTNVGFLPQWSRNQIAINAGNSTNPNRMNERYMLSLRSPAHKFKPKYAENKIENNYKTIIMALSNNVKQWL